VIEELVEQMHRDVEQVRAIIAHTRSGSASDT
jgi:hypothetical protein